MRYKHDMNLNDIIGFFLITIISVCRLGFYDCWGLMGGLMSENIVGALARTRSVLNSIFVGRDREVLAVLSGLVSGEPVILVGPPGSGKTKLVEYLARLVDARYFYYLLTRFTEPDELLGPIDINAFREGRYERVTSGRLPDSEIVFLDEIFKASSAIRNILLDIILYKRVPVGTGYRSLDVLAFYTASNNISREEEDQGFYDRLTIRDFHGFVRMEEWSELIDKGVSLQVDREVAPLLSSESVRRLQKEALGRALKIRRNPSFVSKYIEVLGELKNRGIELSDRRKVKTIIVASAISLIYEEEDVSLDSLADALRFTAPYSEDDISRVEEAILKTGLSSTEYRLRQIRTVKAELTNVLRRVQLVPTEAGYRALDDLIEKSLALLRRSDGSKRIEDDLESLRKVVEEAIRVRGERRVGGSE